MARTLLAAVKAGDIALAKMILNRRLYDFVDAQNLRRDGTALFWACCHGIIELVRLLLTHGARTDSQTAWRATPIHACSDNNHPDIVRLLIKHGADVNAQTTHGDTPCHLAAYRGYGSIVKLIIESGRVNLTLTNTKNRTPLEESIINNNYEISRYISTAMSLNNCLPKGEQGMVELSLIEPDFCENSQEQTRHHPDTFRTNFRSPHRYWGPEDTCLSNDLSSTSALSSELKLSYRNIPL